MHSDQKPWAADRNELRGSSGESVSQTRSPFPGIQARDWVLGVWGRYLLIHTTCVYIWVTLDIQTRAALTQDACTVFFSCWGVKESSQGCKILEVLWWCYLFLNWKFPFCFLVLVKRTLIFSGITLHSSTGGPFLQIWPSRVWWGGGNPTENWPQETQDNVGPFLWSATEVSLLPATGGPTGSGRAACHHKHSSSLSQAPLIKHVIVSQKALQTKTFGTTVLIWRSCQNERFEMELKLF